MRTHGAFFYYKNMKSITLKNISKSYQNRTLFEGVSFSFTKGDRIAITGHNGAGKSTLLKVIAGLEQYDEGSLIKENVSCAYISQEFLSDPSLTVLEYLDNVGATAKVFETIRQFSIITDEQIETAYVGSLSGGQKRVLEIAAVLSTGPMLLCVDEPENHLDIKTRQVLTNLLKEYWGGVLFVSHDRYLVNEISNKIISIQDEQAILMTGKTYEEFQAIEQQKTISAVASWKAESRAIKQMEDSVRMLKARTRYNDAQAKTYQMKKRQLEERQQDLGSRPDTAKEVKINVQPTKRKTGKLIFSSKDMSFSFGKEKPILEKVNIELRFGERVTLLGRNGSGKTTFLNILQQKLIPSSGEVRVGNDIQIQYIDQTNTLDIKLSPLDHFRDHGYSEERARSVLSQFLFTKFESEAALKTLSGGQQQRFTFLFLFSISPECIVLDEPTNNLDPETWELLLHLVNVYTGTLLLISHDRMFVERFENKRTWVLKKKTIKESWDDLNTILKKL
jgi:ATPase subunit of ABC transporter with duplicated ATPase domains